ncbi:MAG: nucleoside deaminase [Saprospiraceae bacterium]
MNEQDEYFLQQAIAMACEGMESGQGGPFGAVIVKDGVIVGKGCNQVTSTNDPTAHAEVVAIRDACRHLQDFQLADCVVYTSCEPCPMCLGAIYWARPARIVYAATHADAADAGFDDSFIYKELPLAPDNRSIPACQLLPDAGRKVFDAWKAKENKVAY